MKSKENEQTQTGRNQKSNQGCSKRNGLRRAFSQRGDQLCESTALENMGQNLKNSESQTSLGVQWLRLPSNTGR